VFWKRLGWQTEEEKSRGKIETTKTRGGKKREGSRQKSYRKCPKKDLKNNRKEKSGVFKEKIGKKKIKTKGGQVPGGGKYKKEIPRKGMNGKKRRRREC